MFRLPKVVLAGVTISAGLLAAACAADNKPAQSSLAQTPQGVVCTKCEVTWVKVPHYASRSQSIVGYSTHKRMVCPDCRDAATNFFTTGKLQHTCKTCGDTMEICEEH